MALSSFFPAVSGMEAQSKAMGSVSTNISNMSTVGYKTSETMFYSLLGSEPVVKGNAGLSTSRSDIHGVGYYVRNLIDNQGLVRATGQNFDVAINGTGNAFFMVEQNGNNYYTRAGDFSTRTTNGKTYLINSSGGKVLGFPASGNHDGSFGGSPEEIELISPETMPSTPTTEMKITANASMDIAKNTFGFTVYGENNDGRSLSMHMNKVDGSANTWQVSFTLEDGTVTTAPFDAVFDGNGSLISPKTFDLSLQWNDGTSQTLHMDIANMTQYAGSNELSAVTQNGVASGSYIKTHIDENGIVKSTYTNGKTFEIAKLAIVGFQAPNNLYPISNTLFEAYPDAGGSFFVDQKGIIAAESLEQSTAIVEKEFGSMMVIQRAYSLNSQAFTVNNEMLQQLVNLKT